MKDRLAAWASIRRRVSLGRLQDRREWLQDVKAHEERIRLRTTDGMPGAIRRRLKKDVGWACDL